MISVVLASYNGQRHIVEQLDSIVNQTLSPDEIIIQDDCSDDATIDVLTTYINSKRLQNLIKLYRNDSNLGFAANFLSAIKRAKGDILFLSDQDDIWKPDKIEKMTALFNQNCKIKSLASDFDVIDEKNKTIAKGKNTKKCKPVSMKSFISYPNFHGMTMAFRRDLIDTLNMTSPLHDWEINYRAAENSGFYFLEESLSMYRRTENNISGLMKHQKSEILKKRIQMLEKIKLCMVLTQNPELEKNITYQTKRIELLKNRKAVKLLLINLLHPGVTAIRPAIGDFIAALKG